MTTTAHTPEATRPRHRTRCAGPPGRRRPVPAHVRVDPDARPVPARCGSNADFVLGAGSDTGVLCGRPLRGRRRPGRHRHGRRAVPGREAAERDGRPRVRRRPGSGGGRSSSSVSSACCRSSPCGTTSPAPPARTPASLVTTGHTLVATYDWAFLLSQSLMPVFNALCLGYVLYRSGLVPRLLPIIGTDRRPAAAGLRPRDLLRRLRPDGPGRHRSPRSRSPSWEFSLGVYLTVKGFKPSPLTANASSAEQVPAPVPA